MAVEPGDLPHVPGVAPEAYEQLAGRYGYAAHEVLRIAGERPELAEPVVPGRVDLLAEAAYAARREQARTVGDVLLRRTRLGLTAGRACRGRRRGRGGARRGRDGAPSSAGTRPAPAREAAAFAAEAAAEGIVRLRNGLSSWPRRNFHRPRRLDPTVCAASSPRSPPLLLARCSRPPPQAGWFAADPVDGPAEIDALGDVDVARDGSGGARLPQARRRRARRSSSRAWTRASGSRRRSSPAARRSPRRP